MSVESIYGGKVGWRYRAMLSFMCGWVPVFVLGIIASQFSIRHSDSARLADHHETTQGTFVQEAWGSHGKVSYAYSVEGRSYSGNADYYGPRPMLPGQPLTVCYLPENPQISMVDDPVGNLRLQLLMAVMLSGWAGIMSWLMTFTLFFRASSPSQGPDTTP